MVVDKEPAGELVCWLWGRPKKLPVGHGQVSAHSNVVCISVLVPGVVGLGVVVVV